MCAWPTKASASARRRRAQSYLNIPAIIAACEITGAEAIHPGYGFLSENAKFAEIVEEHGLTFIGPTARTYPHDGRQDHRQADGEGAGHSHRAGLGRRSRSDAEAARDGRRDRLSGADQGHGGRRRARHEGGAQRRANCPSRLSTARAEAKAAFGNDAVYMEKYLAEAAPYRNPGPRRQPRQGDPSGRARLLAAAPPPESVGRSALPGAQRRRARRDRRRLHQGARPSSAISAPAPSSSSTRTASSISSK